MSGLFGGGSGAAQEQARIARKQTQRDNEAAQRNRQKAERGAGRRSTRSLFLGSLSGTSLGVGTNASGSSTLG